MTETTIITENELTQLRRELETWRAGADNMARECERLKREYADMTKERNDWRTEARAYAVLIAECKDVLADTKRFCNMFARNWKAASDELEAARKVADAAVRYMDFDGWVSVDADIWCALSDAVREYRARAEPAALSTQKAAVIAGAVDKSDEQWEALVDGEVEC